MGEQATLECHSSREVVGDTQEIMESEEEVEERREMAEEGEMKWCRHRVEIAPKTRA